MNIDSANSLVAPPGLLTEKGSFILDCLSSSQTIQNLTRSDIRNRLNNFTFFVEECKQPRIFLESKGEQIRALELQFAPAHL